MILCCYISLKILKKLYKRKYDKVKYVTLKQVLSSSKKYDFIVVGSGTAGSCVAGLLTRDKRRPNVLLIEAGKSDSYHPMSSEVIPCLSRNNQKTDKDWQYTTTSQKGCASLKDSGSSWPRGKVCGGSSILNYMVYVRGNPEDYNEWSEKYKCLGWSWKELVPIFKSFEKCIFKVKHQKDKEVRGFDGFQKLSRKSDEKQWKLSKLFIKAAQNCGYKYNDDYNGVSPDGASYTQYNIDENGRRLTSFRSFVAPLFDNKKENNYNIDILPNAQVTKILCKNDNMNENKKIAFGVEINNDSSQRIYINENNNGEIIISCGTVGTPHLLLLSGIGDADELQKHNIEIQQNVPGVGKNLRDHVMQAFRVIFRDSKLRNAPGIIHEGGIRTIWNYFSEYLFYGTGPVTTTGLDAQIFTKSSIAKKNGLKSNDLQLVQALIGEPPNRRKGAETTSKYFNWDLNKDDTSKWGFHTQINDDEVSKSVMAITMNVRPKSSGSIKLVSSNPFVHPIIDPGYLQNEEDLQVLLEGWQILEQIYTSEPYKSMGAEFVTFSQFSTRREMAEYLFKNYLLTIYHPVGTAKMGNLKSDKYAVCSERLRVRGFSNLRCADASIAPNIVSGNTQAMCYVIGCKAAKMILEDWKYTK